jgi:AraC-like DNA-binding protein
MVVRAALDSLGLHYGEISLGEVNVLENITQKQREELNAILMRSGLELMDNKKAILIEKIKGIIIEMIHYQEEIPRTNFSVFISEKINLDYTYLSTLFSEVTGTTIEHYIISHKIERAKELLLYDELNLSEIALKLHYSNVAHLSNQFKKVTGLTPTFFKKMHEYKSRISHENL